MNGELANLAQLVIAVKGFLNNGHHYDDLIDTRHIYRTSFVFSKPLGALPQNVAAFVDWLAGLKARRLATVKLTAPLQADRNKLGFSGGLDCQMLCFYEGGGVSYWTKHWQADPALQKWWVTYTENPHPQPPAEPPRFADNSASFAQTLGELETFANEIDAAYFGQCFARAHTCLMQQEGLATMLPPAQMRLWNAVQQAFVFGAMGSWNDSPPAQAAAKGRAADYERLSAQLYRELMLAVMYAVNEW